MHIIMKEYGRICRLYHFPRLYHDDCFYDILVRYHMESAHMTFRASTKELFGGNPDLRVTIALPYRANLIYDWLGSSSNITMEMLRDYHSAWQYLQLCGKISQADLVPIIRADAKPGRRKQSLMMSMLWKNLPNMRYCPLCIVADTISGQEAYWHQSHQLYGVKYCPIHGALLQQFSGITLTRRLGRYVPATSVLDASSLEELTNVGVSSIAEAQRLDSFYGLYLRLAHVITWLLKNALSLGEYSDIVNMYNRKLGNLNDSTPTGEALLRLIVETWSLEFLDDLSPDGELLREICRTDLSCVRPIVHALLIGASLGIE